MYKLFYPMLTITSCLILNSCNNDTRNSNLNNNSKSEQLQNKEDINDSEELENIPIEITLPKGLIKIPGYAYIDGRDLNASPPLTVGSINLWNSYNRESVTCKLLHGTKVKVLNAKYDSTEERYYLKIQNGNCEGWVSDPFISSNEMEPVGDIF